MKKSMSLLTGLAVLSIGLAACDSSSNVSVNNETSGQIGKQAKITVKQPKQKTLEAVHTLTVNGQAVKLVTQYGIPDNRAKRWLFTMPSSISLSIKPQQDLPDMQWQVENSYADVSTISSQLSTNGLRQDSMNVSYAAMPTGGYTIDTQNDFTMPFQVEGINQNQTSMTVINGYGSQETKRITEYDLRNRGVNAGSLNVVWTLSVTQNGKTYAKTINDRIGLPYQTTEKQN